MFVFDNYAKLRSREAWADLKFVSFSREELAAGMRKHTKEPIHDPLTEINDDRQVKAVKLMFKNILGFMGDKKYDAPLLLAQELCQFCLTEKWARDEIYCQLIKQLTNNPDAESTRKGFWLMAICLETFPPPEEFENYLECWLRAKAPSADQQRYIGTLHATVYGGQRHAPLTESEMSQCMHGTLRQSPFANVPPYPTPQARIPAHQPPVPVFGVVPISAGGRGMAGYDPNYRQQSSTAAYSAGPPQGGAAPLLPSRKGPAQGGNVSLPPPPAAYEEPMPPPPAPEEERPPCPWAVAYHPETNAPVSFEYFLRRENAATRYEVQAI